LRVMKLVTLPGVFAPRSDSWMLAAAIALEAPEGRSVLDLCCGSGVIGIAAARAGADPVTAVDVSRRAVLTAQLNARRNGVRVRGRRGRLFDPVGSERFDFIVSNPPYVPAPDGGIPTRGPERAWDAGTDGRVLLDEICALAPRHLRPGGAVLLVHSSLIGVEPTLEALAAGGLESSVIERHEGPLGPLMSERAAMLRERGLLDEGQETEEVVLIRAAAPT
jgi:release factor glutamine methyltransferase